MPVELPSNEQMFIETSRLVPLSPFRENLGQIHHNNNAIFSAQCPWFKIAQKGLFLVFKTGISTLLKTKIALQISKTTLLRVCFNPLF